MSSRLHLAAPQSNDGERSVADETAVQAADEARRLDEPCPGVVRSSGKRESAPSYPALQAVSTAVGGAKPQPSDNTLTHFFRTAFNPLDATTFGFNMVGQDPALQRSTTITVDVTPLNVTVGGETFNGTDILQPTLSSPVFTNNDYSSAQFVSDRTVANGHGPGGTLSPGNASNQLEVAGDVDATWWSTRIQNLNNSLSYADPTHLQLYLTGPNPAIGHGRLSSCRRTSRDTRSRPAASRSRRDQVILPMMTGQARPLS